MTFSTIMSTSKSNNDLIISVNNQNRTYNYQIMHLKSYNLLYSSSNHVSVNPTSNENLIIFETAV